MIANSIKENTSYKDDRPNTLWKMYLKVAKVANGTHCWICSSPPIEINALIAIVVPYNIVINDTEPLTSNLQITMQNPYKDWWNIGILKVNISSWNERVC